MSIPKEKDGKNKTFGFVTYIHEVTVPYALNIFAGTKLFGRELLLKYRNSSKNTPRTSLDNNQMPSLVNPWASAMGFNMMPHSLPLQAPVFTQDMLQHQLLQMATAPDFGLGNFPSTRQDNLGTFRERSSRDELVDRNRHRHEDNRNSRNRPYGRRSRSRSPQRNRDRSPSGYRNRSNDRDRRRDNRGSGYNRWNY